VKSLRILWANADFLPLRMALSRVAAPLWPKGESAPGPTELRGKLSLNPGNGAPFRGMRPAGGVGLRGADLVVQAFPSKSRMGPLMPLYYGPHADVAALLTEALPRLLVALRDGAAPDVTPTVSLALGRLPQTQEALAAGVFEPWGLKLHAWDKLLVTDLVAIPPPGAPDADALRLAADHLRAAFGLIGPAGTGQGALLIAPGAAQADAHARAAACGETVAVKIDPERAPLRDLLAAVHKASVILSIDARSLALTGLRMGAAPVRTVSLTPLHQALER
jgi:hypothetical protein